MNIYKEIKERLSLIDIANFYGVETNRNQMANCAFHEDDKPSMKIYDKGFCCYGCQEKGDTLAFVQKLFNLSLPEAAQKINDDFRLNLNPNKKITYQEYQKNISNQEERHLINSLFDETWQICTEYFRLLNQWRTDFAPQNPGDKLHELFVESLHETEIISYICDCFICCDKTNINDKKNILTDYDVNILKAKSRVELFKENEKLLKRTSIIKKLKTISDKEENKDNTNVKLQNNIQL